jgi:hypothetical protein
MTIKELIAQLQTQDPNATIGIKCHADFELVNGVAGLLKVTDDVGFGTIVLDPTPELAIGSLNTPSEVAMEPIR